MFRPYFVNKSWYKINSIKPKEARANGAREKTREKGKSRRQMAKGVPESEFTGHRGGYSPLLFPFTEYIVFVFHDAIHVITDNTGKGAVNQRVVARARTMAKGKSTLHATLSLSLLRVHEGVSAELARIGAYRETLLITLLISSIRFHFQYPSFVSFLFLFLFFHIHAEWWARVNLVCR